MSYLKSNFEQRQAQVGQRPSVSGDTLSSYDINSQFGDTFADLNDSSPSFEEILKNPTIYNLQSCSEVKIGEKVTKIYSSCRSHDSSNAAFVLNDNDSSLKKKIQFALSQKWCWGFLVIFFLLSVIPYFAMTFLTPPPNVSITIDRSFWDDNPNRPVHEPMLLPIRRVVITYTADQSISCTSQADCIERLRAMQVEFIEIFGDIPYNFIIGDDGYVYEGRGFFQQGMIVREDYLDYTDDSGLVVAFIGNFRDTKPSERQQETLRRFLESSVGRDMMISDYVLLQQESLNMESADAFTEFLSESFEENYFEPNHVFRRSLWLESRPDLVKEFNFTTAVKFSDKIITIVFEDINELECSDQDICNELRGCEETCSFPLDACTTRDECRGYLNELLVKDINEDYLYDIRFNFIIGEYGIFEGRGWNAVSEVGSNTLYIGYVSIDNEEDCARYSQQLIENGIKFGKLDDDFKNEELIVETTSTSFPTTLEEISTETSSSGVTTETDEITIAADVTILETDGTASDAVKLFSALLGESSFLTTEPTVYIKLH